MFDWVSIEDVTPEDGKDCLFRFANMSRLGEPSKSIVSGWWCDREGFMFDIGEHMHRYVVTHWIYIGKI